MHIVVGPGNVCTVSFCSCSGIRDVHELNLALRASVGLVGALALLRKHDNMAHIKVKVKVIRPKAWIASVDRFADACLPS